MQTTCTVLWFSAESIFGINCQDSEIWSVQLTLPTSEHQLQEALQVIMISKVLVILAFTTTELVTGDKVPVYSGGPPGYGASAAQDAFNALGEAISGEPGEDHPI